MSEESGTRIQTGARMSQEAYELLRQFAQEHGRTMGEEMDRIIQFYATHHKGQPLPEDLDARLRAVEEYIQRQGKR